MHYPGMARRLGVSLGPHGRGSVPGTLRLMQSLRRLSPITLAACALVALAGACASEKTCSEAPLSPGAAEALDAIEGRIDFALVRPCAFESGLEVTGVSEDSIPEQGVRHPRVSFVVGRDGSHAFTLSQTRAVVAFRAIPTGSHWLRVSAGGLPAEGFAGPTGAGVDLAYLRWRRDGVTFELQATLGRRLTEQGVQEIAAALMER